MPRVSVVIPTFNRKAFLKEAIESVLSQTYRDLEVIVVDDGSEDGTAELVTALADKRIRYVWQPNRGPAAARNHGASMAQGELLAFLDSDDLWTPRKLEKQVSFFQDHPEARICYTDEIWIRRGVRVNPKKKHQKYSGWIYPYCLPLCIISPSSVMFKRELWEESGGFDENFPFCEDYELWLRISSVEPIYLIPQKLIVKRGGHHDQLSRQWGMDVWRVKALMKVLSQRELPPEWKALTVKELLKKAQIAINGFRKRGKFEEAAYLEAIVAKCLALFS